MTELLDCGHPLPVFPAGHTGGTGYGINADGKRIGYACCADNDRAAMIADGRATLYLTHGKRDSGVIDWRVTNWPGSLTIPVSHVKLSPRAGGFGADRTDAWFNGPDGFVWHAVNRGESQIARCRRTKERAPK